jgi:hypothetical protein
MTPQEFVRKWRGNALKEKSFYQQHFLDLCDLVGHPKPADIDRTGDTFAFEATAGGGFVDVFRLGV